MVSSEMKMKSNIYLSTIQLWWTFKPDFCIENKTFCHGEIRSKFYLLSHILQPMSTLCLKFIHVLTKQRGCSTDTASDVYRAM